MALSLPYIVSTKYNIHYHEMYKGDAFKKSMKNATKMFELATEILENENFSNLFVENIGELLLLAATHMRDSEQAKIQFHVKLPDRSQDYYYPEKIFCAILEYFKVSVLKCFTTYFFLRSPCLSLLKNVATQYIRIRFSSQAEPNSFVASLPRARTSGCVMLLLQ